MKLSSLDYGGVTFLVTLLESEPVVRSDLAKELDIASGPALGRIVNRLIKDGLVIQRGHFCCPHCGKDIQDLPLKKADQTLVLTEKGRTLASKLKAVVDEV